MFMSRLRQMVIEMVTNSRNIVTLTTKMRILVGINESTILTILHFRCSRNIVTITTKMRKKSLHELVYNNDNYPAKK